IPAGLLLRLAFRAVRIVPVFSRHVTSKPCNLSGLIVGPALRVSCRLGRFVAIGQIDPSSHPRRNDQYWRLGNGAGSGERRFRTLVFAGKLLEIAPLPVPRHINSKKRWNRGCPPPANVTAAITRRAQT